MTVLQQHHPSPSTLSKLKNLTMEEVHKLESLPEEISNLKSLQNLEILFCCNLNSLPERIGSLSLLTHLRIKQFWMLASIPNEIGSLPPLEYVNYRNPTKIMVELVDYLRRENKMYKVSSSYTLYSFPAI